MNTESFIDTTILIDVSEAREPTNANALKHLRAHPPAHVSDYAYRELLVGRVGLLCSAHNKIYASNDVIEAVMSLLSQASFGRTPIAKAQEILKPLQKMFSANASITPAEAKREVLEELMLVANSLWRAASKFPGASHVQPLPCLNRGSLKLDNGILRGPNDSFNCAKKTICGAAQYMYEDRANLRKMILALEAVSLPEEIKNKQETKSRRNALKLLESRGPSYINKRKCRQLGDAYFAAMCPPGAHVLTTNIDDFLPLCSALNKEVLTPNNA